MKNIISCDNGLDGGIVFLSSLGQIVAKIKMPVKLHESKREIDVLAVKRFLGQWCVDASDTTALIEMPSGSKSVNAAKSMAASFHALRCAFELLGFDVRRVRAKEWQGTARKTGMLNCASGQSKPAALARAREIWPTENWILKGCRVPHDGIVDAALMGFWFNGKKRRI